LIDTGASQSCIDKSLVERLHLVRSGEDKLVGVGGEVDANVYHAIVDVPALGYRQPMALFSPLDESIPSMVLLGRDFLSDFVFVYEGREECFSFFRASQHPDDHFDGDDG
jgi:predicted aspartyl protease